MTVGCDVVADERPEAVVELGGAVREGAVTVIPFARTADVRAHIQRPDVVG